MSQKRQIRVYIDDEDTLGQIRGPMSETQVATLLLSAALAAVRENHGKVTLPLRFHIDGLTEPARAAPPKRKAV